MTASPYRGISHPATWIKTGSQASSETIMNRGASKRAASTTDTSEQHRADHNNEQSLPKDCIAAGDFRRRSLNASHLLHAVRSEQTSSLLSARYSPSCLTAIGLWSEIVFIIIFISHLFATMTLSITTPSLVSWHSQSIQQGDQMQLPWRLTAEPSMTSKLIPSARYVYTPASSPASLAAITARNEQESKRERILFLHSQLNQLKNELDAELGSQESTTARKSANSAGQSVADSGQFEHTRLVPLVILGSPCLSSSFCNKSIRNSRCNLENFTCDCLSQHVRLNSTACLAPSLLGYECQLDSQCQQRVPESICQSGKCSCPAGSFVPYKKNKCLTASKLNEYCLLDDQCQLNDKHTFCKWKIQNIYGTCKCPPNYKLLTDHQNNLRCYPRLGDSCLSDQECQLVTPNSICRDRSEASAVTCRRSSHQHDNNNNKWPASTASNKCCTCSEGFESSKNQLDCVQIAPLSSKTNATLDEKVAHANDRLEHHQPQQQDSHKYEMIVIPTTKQEHTETAASNGDNYVAGKQQKPETSTEREELEIKLISMESEPRQQQATITPLTTTTSTTTVVPKVYTPGLNDSAKSSQVRPPPVTNVSDVQFAQPFRMSSLGKPCRWRQECQARDPFSDCIGGICECLAPSERCRASRTGCHQDTFQCRNGQCISWYFVCDQFKNCDDGSDEDDCEPRHCPREAFQCSQDGACVTKGKVCNGKRDCLDGSDELNCGQQLQAGAANNSLQTGTPFGCHPDAFTCSNGQCLPGYVFCNAVEDCTDGSDEDELVCERQRPPAKGASANLIAMVQEGTRTDTRTASLSSPQLKQGEKAGQQQQESPLVKTDRASIERLMASLALGQRTPEKRGRIKTTAAKVAPHTRPPPAFGGGRRSKLLIEKQPSSSDSLQVDSEAVITADLTRSHPAASKQDTLVGANHKPPPSAPDECPRWAFTCRNGKCRSSAILCSGVDGCGDNSDENQCEVCQCEAPPPATTKIRLGAGVARTTNSRRHNGWIATPFEELNT